MKNATVIRLIFAATALIALCSCAAGHIKLTPFGIEQPKPIAKRLIITPIEFRYDDPSLQPRAHWCLRTLIPLMPYTQTSRSCFGSAFLIHPKKTDEPELIPKEIARCIKQSLENSKIFNSVEISSMNKESMDEHLVLHGQIKECREVGYGTSYGLSFIGTTACIVIPIIPTNYGNHINFAMELQLIDSLNGKVVWQGQIKGETKKRVRFFWQVRDLVHGTNDFDKVLSKYLQANLPLAINEMAVSAGKSNI